MCYSEEQSRKTFIINLITSYILYNYKGTFPTYKILALFFSFVGIMQLFDIIFWTNQNIKDSKQGQTNYITTKLAMFINHLQPIVFAYLIYIFTGSLGKFSKIAMFIYTIIIILYTLNIYNKIDYTLVNDENNMSKPILKWDWNLQEYSLPVYIIFLISLSILAYENFEYPFNILLVFINLSTFMLSAYYYKGKLLGRFWCKFAAWIPLLFIAIDKMIK